MKVSLITVTYNTAAYVKSCIESVLSQDYADIEYIIVDGASTDGTVEIVKGYGDRISTFVTEPDKGIYDAMNKGLKLATGDLVGILNADDFYPHNQVVSTVVKAFEENDTDTLFADLVYVDAEETDKIVRYFPGKGFHPGQMKRGIMPPHPTYFVKRYLYEQHGLFDTSYKICADFDLMVRLFVKENVSYQYLPEVLVHMRAGGVSTDGIKSTQRINQEMLQALKKYGVNSNMALIYSKYITKVFQLVKRPG